MAAAPNPSPLDLSGAWRVHVDDGDLARRFTATDYDDADWPTIDVPGHWQSNPLLATTDGPVLYRRTVEPTELPAGQRRFLTFDGIFYFGDAWLDGHYLGATEGYFFPHTFEITRFARNAPDAHTVAVEVANPPQTDRTAKRSITGVFSHWDNLDPEWNPGGIWRPVRIRDTGPVRISWLRVLCTEASEARGQLRLDVTVDPGVAPPHAPVTLVSTVVDESGTTLAEETTAVDLTRRGTTLTVPIVVEGPPRWWPWRHGRQPRVHVEVRVLVDGVRSDHRRVTTAFRSVTVRDWQWWVNGEPIFVMGANHGPTRMALAEATRAELARDVELARLANLDLLRVHAHVTRPEFYDAADAAGLLLWQDFPLQWGYGRGARKQASRQAREMVDRLGHHPSIAMWCAHNEPLALAFQPGEPITPGQAARVGASMFLPSWNKDVLDRSVSHAIHKADPTRSVDVHSGVFPGIGSAGTDTHFYFGWYHGEMDGLAPALRAMPRLARFVSEFGAQAVPRTADFMEPERWPDLDWDHLFHRHACQKTRFDEYVPPAAFASFETWQLATQRYQAALIQLQVEDLRRLRRSPTGGFCLFCFADGHPSVTWSVLDHERVPKVGFAALRDSCRSVLPMLEPRKGLLHVVNETTEVLTGAAVEVTIDGRRRSFVGDIAAGDVTYVGRVHLDHRTGEVELRLRHPAVGTVEHRYDDLLDWLRIVNDTR
ncbi:MAG: sugar-binding domain-containing protein [Acidimicrobiia bacterium]